MLIAFFLINISGKYEKTTSWIGNIYKAILSIAAERFGKINNKIKRATETKEIIFHKDFSLAFKANL